MLVSDNVGDVFSCFLIIISSYISPSYSRWEVIIINIAVEVTKMRVVLRNCVTKFGKRKS